MLNESLESTARSVLSHAPCSLEMPAGSGKTHLLAATVAIASMEGKRSLILTHTNAGVDALRKRLSKFGVAISTYHIDTITSWAYTLVRAYEEIAELKVPEIPDWSDSGKYIDAATRVANSTVIKLMHSCSFNYFFVDEYQDCNLRQHKLIVTIADSILQTVVLGDRLQGIFGFAGETLVDWDEDVFLRFPQYQVAHSSHRWNKSNPELGRWLSDIRPSLVNGTTLDFSQLNVPGLTWVCSSPNAVTREAYRLVKLDETVVLIDKWPQNLVEHATRLNGFYSIMEELQGKFMIRALTALPSENNFGLAAWLADFAKNCAIGLSDIDGRILTALRNNRCINHLKREGFEHVLNGLDELRENPSFGKLIEVALIIQRTKGVKIYRWEAWSDTIMAIENCIQESSNPLDELMRLRDRLRKIGRRTGKRIASRTLLVKGLEYDHVIIADVTNIRDPRNLYVAMTRAVKSVTLISPSPRVVLKSDNP